MLLLLQALFCSAAFTRNPNPGFQIPEPLKERPTLSVERTAGGGVVFSSDF
jgi:hypothetical protein